MCFFITKCSARKIGYCFIATDYKRGIMTVVDMSSGPCQNRNVEQEQDAGKDTKTDNPATSARKITILSPPYDLEKPQDGIPRHHRLFRPP